MRVIQVAPTPFGASGLLGGGERYPLMLARALAREVPCDLVTFGPRAAIEHDPGGLRIRTLRAVRYRGGHPAHPLAWDLPAALAGATVIHTHHLRSTPSKVAALVGRAFGAQLAVTDHGLQGSDWHGSLPRLFDRFLMVSAYSAREAGAPPARTRIIYGGADTELYAPDPSITRHGVLFVGRLTPHKGVDRLIQALPEGATLRIVGSGGHDPLPPERDYPDLLRRLAVGRDVQFLGPVPDATLAALYRQAAVLVLPSVERTCYGKDVRVSELLGLVILEAMASGTPVIASWVGGVPEIVEHGTTGFVVTPGDTDELHGRLQQLLADPPLAAWMGQNAREQALTRFTWRACAEACLEAYASADLRRRL